VLASGRARNYRPCEKLRAKKLRRSGDDDLAADSVVRSSYMAADAFNSKAWMRFGGVIISVVLKLAKSLERQIFAIG